MEKHYLILLLFVMFFLSCSKKQGNEIDDNNFIKNRNEIEIVQDDFTFLADNDQKNINKLSESKEDEKCFDWDDSVYDDNVTLEFSMHNKENQNFCLYHNIKKIESINLNNYIENGNWCTKFINDMNITWNYENGAILCMETSSCNYETKRGVKVGDLLSNVMDLYGPDSDISSWDTSSNSFISVDNKDNNLFMLFYANDGVSLNAGNIIDEEMMTILFYANEGVITKIEIKSGN